MKKYLTEKNFMWAAIAVLGLSVFGPTGVKCDCEKNMKSMRERMSQGMRQWQGNPRKASEQGQRGERGKRQGERKKAKTEEK